MLCNMGIGFGIDLAVNAVRPQVVGASNWLNTLTINMGTWYGSPMTYTYQWRRNGVNISETTNQHVVGLSEVGGTFDVIITATNGAGTTTITSLSN